MVNTVILLLLANPVFNGFPANRVPDPDFLGLKPSQDQDKSIDIRYSQIGTAVLELLNRQTNKHPAALYKGTSKNTTF